MTEHLDSVRFGGTAGAYRLVRHYRGPDTVAYLGEPKDKRIRPLRATPTPMPRSSR